MLLNCGVGEDSWESLDCKEIKPVNPKGYQLWIFFGRTDAETETPIFWPPDVKSQLIGKDPDAGKDRGQEEKGATEEEMVGLHHWLSGQEFEQTLEDREWHGSLACCSPWGCKKLDTTEQLNKNKKYLSKNVRKIHFGHLSLYSMGGYSSLDMFRYKRPKELRVIRNQSRH